MISIVDGPDADEARDLLVRELAKPEYNQPEGLLQRISQWIVEQLNSMLNVLPGSGSLSTLLIILVVVIVLAAAAFAFRQRLRDRGLGTAGDSTVLEDENLSAKDYRLRADRAAAAQDWDTVLLDSYRALTASAGQRTLLDNAPTRTAHEVAATLAVTFPDHNDELLAAADAFDRVRYGRKPCQRPDAERVRELDLSVEHARPDAAWTHA